jgi:putative membrane protein
MPDMPELARERTDFAEDRTILANERTFGSWLRTGFGGIGIGLGFHALFGKIQPIWLPRAIASAFLVIAIIIFVAAERRASTVIHRLHTHQVETVKIGILRLITFVTVAATLALIAALWLFTL